MAASIMNAMNQHPRITLDLIPDLDPNQQKIHIQYENIPAGWVAVAQLLCGALTAALPQAFEQIQQQSAAPKEQKRIVVVSGMDRLH